MWVRACIRQVASRFSHLRESKHVCWGYAQTLSCITQRYQYTGPIQKMDTVTLNPPSEHAPYTLTKDQEETISQGDPEKLSKLHQLMLKLYVKRQEGLMLPGEIRIEDIQIMTNLGTVQLIKMLQHLKRRYNSMLKRAQEKEEYHANLAAVREGRADIMQGVEHPWLQYSLHLNSLFPRIYKTNIHRLSDTYMARGLQLGQEVVVDCSYDSYMDELRIKHTAKQILYCTTINRKDRRPFSLHLCNVDGDSRLMYYLRRLNPGFEHDAPVGIHNCSYMDLFDRKRLVYLTPHTEGVLEYNPDDIYILGALVDLHVGLPLSNKKAGKEQIRTAALPLKHYVKWKKGAKSLCIHQVFGALLTVKNTGDWSKALLEQVPSRKIH